MPYRINTYEEAFDLIGVALTDNVRAKLKKLELEGHTEKSICFVIWKTQAKLMAFKYDNRFWGVFVNEVNKWSWKKDDPRWDEYWKRKKEAERAEAIRKEITRVNRDEKELKRIDTRAKRPIKKIKGYVYFIQGLCGGAIKIGYSADPSKRLKELQTGYPDTLTLVLMIPGDENTERALHNQFEASRLKGEWFRPDRYVIDKIKELKLKYNQ